MKLELNRKIFLKSWTMAEKIASKPSPQPSLNSIHFKAESDGTVLLEATDLKTSIRKNAGGVKVLKEGKALIPINPFGDLLKKISDDLLILTIEDNQGHLQAGKNTYQISLYENDLFPDLPTSAHQQSFATVDAQELNRLLEEGVVAGNPAEDFPRYLSACQFHMKNGELRIISTDGRRLSLSTTLLSEDQTEENSLLVPLDPMKEFQRFLSGDSLEFEPEAFPPVVITQDQALVQFCLPGLEYAVRRVDSTFPNYERLLTQDHTTAMVVDRAAFIAALERVDLIVRKHQRLVIFHLSPGGDLQMLGRSSELGEAREHLSAEITGEPLTIGFNLGYLLDGLKAARSNEVRLTFNGNEGQSNLFRSGTTSFRYMTMPMKIQQDAYDFS